ncbi:MAG: DsbA family protein [Burkholderiaceae bacterium]|jgi:2-hydroxychromene-2-carboxylate isomerase
MESSKKKAVWYFDFVSPYAYLQSALLARLAKEVDWVPRPILFAGLLKHWGTLGPAELAPKRQWTYEQVAWLANEHGIALKMPRAHPFNPLPLLRLSLVGSTDGVIAPDRIERLFRFVWAEGNLPTDTGAWDALLEELGTDPGALERPEIRAALRANGERALADHVFGVPTTVVSGRRFWGFDSTPMLTAFIRDDPFFESERFKKLADLPVGVIRKPN